MFDWLRPLVQNEQNFNWREAAARLIAAVLFGIVIALMHAVFRRQDTRRPGGLGTTLILLTVIVSFVIYVIGNNPARAFGLVGALSIIRFRTSVSDTRDTSFVIFAVAIGMALGAGYFIASLIALPVVAAVCAIMTFAVPVTGPGGQLIIRAETATEADAAINAVGSMLRWRDLQSASSGKKDGGVELTFRVCLKAGSEPSVFLDNLRQRPGVMRVTWASG